MKILVPLDGSGLSEVVLPWAKLLGSKVELMKSYMPLDNIKLSPELPITIAEMVDQFRVLAEQGTMLAQSLGYHEMDAVVLIVRDFLLQTRHGQPLGLLDLAIIRMDLLGNHLHQSGLAGSVTTNQTKPLPRVDGQGDVIQQRLLPITELNVAEGNQRHTV